MMHVLWTSARTNCRLRDENDIRFVLNIAKSPAVIEVYRRGYCKEDVTDTPLYELANKRSEDRQRTDYRRK